MKIFILISIILALLVISSRGQIEQECWHGGKLENGECQCFPGYYGDYCERFNCSNQAKDCGISLTTDLCSVPDIKEYCPGMCKKATCNCGFDKCFNNGTFNENDCKCNCTTGFIGELCENKEKCNVTECKNSGKFNSETCQCDCFANYKGEKCEILDCIISDPASCISYTIDDCFLNEIENYCPKLCKKCIDIVTETTKLTTTINKCEKKCVNGGQLTENCTCECYPNYSGEQCEKIDCNLEDPQKCLEYSIDLCYNNEIKNYCPKLCKQCDDKTTTQKLTTSTQKSATTTEKCEKKCENGGLINSNCSCECYPNYQGEECETLNCDMEEPTNCLKYTIDFCYNEEVKNYCPKLCRKCGDTSVSPNTTSNKETTILSTEILLSTESTNASPNTETSNFSKETITTFEDKTPSNESTIQSTEYSSSTEYQTFSSYSITSSGDTSPSEESTILTTDFSSSGEYQTSSLGTITSSKDTSPSEESTILSTDFPSSSEYQTFSSDPITSSGDTSPSEESTILSTDFSSSGEYQTSSLGTITSSKDTSPSEESTILSTDFSSSGEYQTSVPDPITSSKDTSPSEESTILSTDFPLSSEYQTSSTGTFITSGNNTSAKISTIISTELHSSTETIIISTETLITSKDILSTKESTINSTNSLSSPKYTTNLCTQILCQNNGVFDPASCKCSCISGYSGNDCSIGPDCGSLPNDPDICSKDFCLDNDLKVLCPKTCNCQNSPVPSSVSTITTIINPDTIFSKESTKLLSESSSLSASSSISPEIVSTFEDTTNVNVPTILISETDSIIDSTITSFDKTTVSQNLCFQILCQNNGVFDPASCKCSCISGYSGNDCSFGPDCGSLPNDPDVCTKDFCLDNDLKTLCPKTCNCQISPILSTISSEPCIQVQCQNNGLFDPLSCKCSCISGFSGNNCSIGPDCETLQDDQEICSKDLCLDNDLKVLCPKTCICTL